MKYNNKVTHLMKSAWHFGFGNFTRKEAAMWLIRRQPFWK